MTVRAIFEDGVFKPTEPVDLPDHTHVEFEPKRVGDQHKSDELTPERAKAIQEIYRIMGERYDTGERDVAERHDEHQP
ncbi:MAG TPA: antitoxin family protein [Tepidisphaeraceae bacterium]|jgi:predicted DNA-binding antitoxin AbrB/MazE fold protein|nr:antitoxin family protein [Tepidisphaeraceae bacterium]